MIVSSEDIAFFVISMKPHHFSAQRKYQRHEESSGGGSLGEDLKQHTLGASTIPDGTPITLEIAVDRMNEK